MDVTVTDPLVGRLLEGRYRVGKRVARGGMATVYEALDTRLDRVVAIKIMHSGLGDDAEFAHRFVREARSAARLSHPNVVAVFDQGEDNGTLFLAMEYVPGRTLRQLMRERGPLPPATALELMEKVLQALAAAHDAGIIHRDVKPENVLLGNDGSVKVADFGLARAISAATSGTATQGLLIGTVSYLAPEQVVHGTADTRTDVYAAGIMLSELLTGAKPHEGDSPIQVAYKHVHEDVPAPSGRVPGLPPYVDGLVLRSTARDHDVRPADARVFLQHVRRARSALVQGVDDPELTEDLTLFRRQIVDDPPGTEHTRAIPIGAPMQVDEYTPTSPPFPPGPPPGPRQDSRRQPQPPKRGKGPLALLIVLILTVAVGVGAWYVGIARFTRVPPVTNATQQQFAQLEQGSEVDLKTVGTAFSEVIPKGRAVRSEPAAGSRVRKGSVVQVWVSSGPERYPVPNLSGKTEVQAKQLLDQAHLAVGRIGREYSDKVDTGLIIRFSPKPGTQLRPNAAVAYVVSRGRKPVQIPSVVGDRSTAAEKTLKKAGFQVVASEEFSDTVERGRVISQDPPNGNGYKGDKIRLVVSKGPALVKVPNVRGMGEEAAKQRLQRDGFKTDVRESPLYVGVHYVVEQSPNGGQLAPAGSTIVITIV
ncbi:Stk1 family PASTA domain-containing Ser/Thr kinase [Tenggerimyces flavus]|uniref:non-specific serine/threonine protein kinase n=1 Tax=Tenggerimyces flavus TaxID=1708749 RepID=A0ABV7Y5D4_9ACTN